MLEKLLEYEKLLKNDYSILATIFDPRFKLDYFKDKSEYDHSMQLFKTHYENCIQKLSIQTVMNVEKKSFKDKIFKRQKINSEEDEIETYFNSPKEYNEVDPIYFWKNNSNVYPVLSKIAFDFLVIPATSVPSEQIFSKSGSLITKLRNRLDKSTVQSVMLLQSWNLYLKH
jgi:hypothetical protein